MSGHKLRAHSKFSASGSERWLNCAASVALEELAPPSADSPWSLEGTEAHEVLEVLFKMFLLEAFKSFRLMVLLKDAHPMIKHAYQMVSAVFRVKKTLVEPELLIEQRIYNTEIHEEMFGTVDAALVELFGTLHVFDYKYGKGHVVSAVENKQMIQYALGLAERYDWNFSDVVVHIMQPRAGANWHKQWKLSIDELKDYRELWRKGVARVESGKSKPFEGSWCHWCRAKATCPAKVAKNNDKISSVFSSNPFTERPSDGLKKESHQESFKKGYKKSSGKKANPFQV